MGAALAGLMILATPGFGQAFSAQITGTSAWTDGVSATVSWTYSGTPSAIVTQQGIRVWSTSLNGSAWSSSFTNAVALSARTTSVITHFRNTANYTMQIVLKDANGTAITPAYSVSVRPGTTTTTPTAPTTGNPATVSAACRYVLGVDCMASGNAYASVGSYLVGNPAQFPTQAAMQTYLTNYIGTNVSVKSTVIQAASTGQNLCTQAMTALTNSFTANPSNTTSGLWNSYTQLAPLVAGAVKSQCTAVANAAYVTAACQYVLGVDCSAGNAGSTYNSLAAYFKGNAASFPTQAAMQQYLMNYIQQNPNLRTTIIQQASAGQTAAGLQAICTQAQTALTNAFTSNPNNSTAGLWNSYTQLRAMLPGILQSQCPAATASTGATGSTAQQLSAAMTTAFVALTGQNPTAQQSAAILSGQTSAAAMTGAVRSYIARDTALQGQIVDNTYQKVYGTKPQPTQHTQVAALYGRNWTAMDDLTNFLNANKTAYTPPAATNTGTTTTTTPTAAQKPTAIVSQILVNVNGTPVYLPSQLGGKCMTVEGQTVTGSTTYAGARIIGYQCQAVSQERFVFMNNGQLRDHDGQNMCLDLNGAQVVTQPCSNAATQVWSLYGDGTIRNGQTGSCMDLQGGAQNWILNAVQSAVNWQQPVIVVGCNGSTEQKWAASTALAGSANHSPANTSIVQNGQLGTLNTNIVSHNGSAIVAAGAGNIVAAGAGNIVAAGAGNIVAAGAGNLTMNTIGGAIVSKSPAEIVAAGAGNIVAAGAGNIVAAGAGNIVLTSTGAAAMIPMTGANIVAAGAGNAVQLNLGAGVISLPYQGGSLINGMGAMLAPASGVVAIGNYK